MNSNDIRKLFSDIAQNKFSQDKMIKGNRNGLDENYSLNDTTIKNVSTALKNKFHFVTFNTIEYSGDSQKFKGMLFKNEEAENKFRLYTLNNYNGFGYKKNIEDFENLIQNVFEASVYGSNINVDEKEKRIERLKTDIMGLYTDRTLTDSDVIKGIEKKVEQTSKDLNINLSENIAKSSAILISKYRLSIHNLRKQTLLSSDSELDKIEETRVSNIKTLNGLIDKYNVNSNEEKDLELKDIFLELRTNSALSSELFTKISDSLGKESALKMQSLALNIEKQCKIITRKEKSERLSSIALNYLLAEKNVLEMNDDIDDKINFADIIPALSLSNNKEDSERRLENKINKSTIKKSSLHKDTPITKENFEEHMSSELNNYIERVYSKIRDNNNLSFYTSKKEIADAIFDAREIFLNKNGENESFYNLLEESAQEIKTNAQKLGSNVENNINNLVINSVRDMIYNRIEQSSDGENIIGINVEKNLKTDSYMINKQSQDDILSCDNMNKMFKLIKDKSISTDEAQEIIENNREFLKTFTSKEREAVGNLIEDIGEIKKLEIENEKKDKNYKKYLFEDLPTKDKKYDARTHISEFMKRGYVDKILGEESTPMKRFTRQAVNLFMNKHILNDLSHCSSKKVESRSMDTGLSMISQCIDNFKQRIEEQIKKTEDGLHKLASNPISSFSGLPALLSLILIFEKSLKRVHIGDLYRLENDINDVVTHIDSIPEQKTKDALAQLYKQDMLDDSNIPEYHTIYKEELVSVKNRIFYADMLKEGKKEIVGESGRYIKQEDLVLKEPLAIDQLKAILTPYERINKSLTKDIIKELKEYKLEVEKQKEDSFLVDNLGNKITNENAEVVLKERKESYLKSKEQIEDILEKYKELYSKVNTGEDNKGIIKDAKDLNNSFAKLDGIENEIDRETIKTVAKELKSAYKNLNDIKTNLLQLQAMVENGLSNTKTLDPYVDILNDDGTKIDEKKLKNAINESPEKVLILFKSLNTLKNFDENTKRDLMRSLTFNVLNGYTNKSGVDLGSFDTFNKVAKDISKYDTNYFDELSNYLIDTQSHPDIDKLKIAIKNRSSAMNNNTKDNRVNNTYDNLNEYSPKNNKESESLFNER